MSERPLIWFKGKPTPAHQALIPVLSPSAQFGLNVFEGIRGYSNRDGQVYLFRVADHLRRLMQSCRLLDIESPYSVDQILEAALSIVKTNHMHVDLSMRVTLFVDGLGSWSSLGPVNMFVAPISKPRRNLLEGTGQTAVTSTWRRIEDQYPTCKSWCQLHQWPFCTIRSPSPRGQFADTTECRGEVAGGRSVPNDGPKWHISYSSLYFCNS